MRSALICSASAGESPARAHHPQKGQPHQQSGCPVAGEMLKQGFTLDEIGKRLLGIRTIRTNGTLPGFKWAALRTLLLLSVVPACLTDRDQRGLHDRAADMIVVRL